MLVPIVPNNNGWADDEAHFRNILTLAGQPNSARHELWETTVLRSFDKVDGLRRLNDLSVEMQPVHTANGEARYMVFPGEDKRIIRVMKKVIRGLCYYHKAVWPIPDQRVWVDVLKYAIPQHLIDQMEYHHREQDIAEYRYQVLDDDEMNSVWLITFFQRVTFVGAVSVSENGFAKPKAGLSTS